MNVLGDNLLEAPIFKDNTVNQNINEDTVLRFINTIEGWKTRCKNLHWAAPEQSIHAYLDDFLTVLSGYQDGLAEEYMGINGKMQPTAVTGVPCNSTNAMEFIKQVRLKTLDFYSTLSSNSIYAGVRSECETFIHEINKYNYLFGLCYKEDNY